MFEEYIQTIEDAQRDLGVLTFGQMVDLLLDNHLELRGEVRLVVMIYEIKRWIADIKLSGYSEKASQVISNLKEAKYCAEMVVSQQQELNKYKEKE